MLPGFLGIEHEMKSGDMQQNSMNDSRNMNSNNNRNSNFSELKAEEILKQLSINNMDN